MQHSVTRYSLLFNIIIHVRKCVRAYAYACVCTFTCVYVYVSAEVSTTHFFQNQDFHPGNDLICNIIMCTCMRTRERARVQTATLEWWERAAKDISLKLETQDCTTNPEIPPRKAEFPIFYKLRITGLFLEKETYTGIPGANPLRSLNTFYKRTFVSRFGAF